MHPSSRLAAPSFSISSLLPGARLGLAVSGGADSVALLRLAHGMAGKHGWRLLVLHVEHGLRGDGAEHDAAFVERLSAELGLPCSVRQADAKALARQRRLGLEEAGRRIRSEWFAERLGSGELDAVATGHTLDDQAETVLAKLLRGAWTAGLGGISPAVAARDLPGGRPEAAGQVVRPLLGTRRAELRAWLQAIGQQWREDETNQDPRFTRNRIRARLLPALAEFNPRIAVHLAEMSALARDDEQYWQAELARVLPGLFLPGRSVRGGGRAISTRPEKKSVGMEAGRLRALAPALRGRVVRAAAGQLGVPLGFGETARVLRLLEGSVGATARREQLTGELRAERTPRELRLVFSGPFREQMKESMPVPVPGEASGWGVRLRVEPVSNHEPRPGAILRAALPSDRVRLRYSGGSPKRVKEVLERMGVASAHRDGWPVLEWEGELVWVKGAVLEPTPISSQIVITAEDLLCRPASE